MFGLDFYPTPRTVAYKMLDVLTNKNASTFLEPSAGRGDLAQAILDRRDPDHRYRRENDRESRITIECIEQNPELCAILRSKHFPVIGVDFLTYPGVCFYDAIIMNPPFSNGAEHLLRAWEFLHNGEIVCLLNEETIKNPHTKARQDLAKLIHQHGSVEYLGPVFTDADRETRVNVAMIHMTKVAEDDRAELWGATGSAEKQHDFTINEETLPALQDVLGNMEHFYNAANEHMFKAMEHARKAAVYLAANSISSSGPDDCLKLAFQNVNSSRAAFSRLHRRNAWKQVFDKMHFHKWLDHKQNEELLRDIERESTVPFTAENIKATLQNVLDSRKRLFEQSCANVFDALTTHFKGNTSESIGSGDGASGWKSNYNYKVAQKLVFPYGIRHEKDWGFSQNYSREISIYSDLDRLLAILDGTTLDNIVSIGAAITAALQRDKHSAQTITSTYFQIRYFKKGTVHLKFHSTAVMEKFNKAAAAGKLWLGQQTNQKNNQ